MVGGRMLLAALAAAVAAAHAAPALADDGWLPHPADATWTYEWSDSAYSPTPTKEKVTVASSSGLTFSLAWTTDGLGNPAAAVTSSGTATFQESTGGPMATDWKSTPPPASFPVLCSTAAACPNSLAGSLYAVIWGSRSPVLQEPLLDGATWSSTGGAQNDVGSTNAYLGTGRVSVPAFPQPVTAAVVRSQITQAGALGDPYGSGVRTVWWVYGVGPVKVVFRHAGGDGPVTTVQLDSTNQTPKPAPSPLDYFPLQAGATSTYRWTNPKHLSKPVVDRFHVDAVQNGTARVSVGSVSGPIRASGAYVFTLRLDGLTTISANTAAAAVAKLPALGPKALPPAQRRHFFTPFDLMTFGIDPVLPAYPAAGMRWSVGPGGRDFAVFGVRGTSTVLGVQRVRVPAGTFSAVAVRSVLTQPGFPFGSGVRTSWFAPGKGLVKLVFRHRDGSVSTVELLR